MYIGGSIFLIAVGAIFSFAVQDSINGIDLVMVGYILMAAGLLGIVLSLFVNAQSGQAGGRRDEYPPR